MNHNDIVCGGVLRFYATADAGDYDERLSHLQETVALLRSHVHPETHEPLFHSISIYIWADQRFAEADTRNSFETIKALYSNDSSVDCFNFEKGDIFCELLNSAIARNYKAGLTHTLCVSPSVRSYLTQENISALVSSYYKGARVSGLALFELKESILSGRIANTCALWHNESLLQVGGFNLLARKASSSEKEYTLKGRPDERGIAEHYVISGVEEMLPLAFMTQTFGPCIAPIVPQGDTLRFDVPADPVARKKHFIKMETKKIRQDDLLARGGSFAPNYLLGGILPDYYQDENPMWGE